MNQNEFNLLTVEQAAPIANIKPFRFYELIRRGDVPNGVVVRLGARQIRINEARLIEWLGNGGTATQTGKTETEENSKLRLAA